MKCAYCGQELQEGNSVAENGLEFCNTLHRYQWREGSHRRNPVQPLQAQARSEHQLAGDKNLLIRRILFGIVYFIVFYFVISILLGGIAGGIAGVKAGQAGSDPSAVGRIAGQRIVTENFGIIVLFALLLSAVGVWKRWLPGTRRKRADRVASPPPAKKD